MPPGNPGGFVTVDPEAPKMILEIRGNVRTFRLYG
jgi:hypothetical protein